MALYTEATIHIDNRAAFHGLVNGPINNDLAQHDFDIQTDEILVEVMADGTSRVRLTLEYRLDKVATDNLLHLSRRPPQERV